MDRRALRLVRERAAGGRLPAGPAWFIAPSSCRSDGAWPEAIEEARNAHSRVRPSDRSALADARYQEGEIHRLRGAVEDAERCFKEASAHGQEPQPGLALLRLASGQREVAQSAIRRVVAETQDPLTQAKLLPAAVEIHLAVGDVAGAREACARLDEIAASFATEVLGALAAHGARAAPPRRGGRPGGARAAATGVLGLAEDRRALPGGARARGSGPGLSGAGRRRGRPHGAGGGPGRLRGAGGRPRTSPRWARPPAHAATKPAHGLTQRELQVLRLVAAGKTNKLIARELFLSEKTVDRHLSNIFVKLNVGSRTAATAWAYEHDLV